jgi:hypothetical protein
VSPLPSRPKNPALLLGDTDVVVQILVSGLTAKLHVFRRSYGIQPVITEAVAGELPGLLRRRFGDRVAGYEKALKHKAIVTLDDDLLSRIYGGKGRIIGDQIDALGKKIWEQGAGRGEAYTHAAGILLNLPVVTNDMEAIRVLRADQSTGIPERVLRFFDVVVFFFQIGELTLADCDSVRQQLIGISEHVPTCFQRASFEDGLKNFFPRLLDSTAKRIGSETVRDQRLDQTTYLTKPEATVIQK